MARLRYNGLATDASTATVPLALGGSGLTNSATSVTFNAALTHSNGTAVPTITGTDYIPLSILDASGHLSEVVWLTAYTAAATTGTIARGKAGTSGVAHASGDKIIQGPLASEIGGRRFSTALGSNFTSSTNDTDLTITGLSFSFTPAVDGTLLLYGRFSALKSASGRISFWVHVDNSPTGSNDPSWTDSTATESGFGGFTLNVRRTVQIVGSVDVVAGTAYTVTGHVTHGGGGSVTVYSSSALGGGAPTEIGGVFIPS